MQEQNRFQDLHYRLSDFDKEVEWFARNVLKKQELR